jgi:hypothetical protein
MEKEFSYHMNFPFFLFVKKKLIHKHKK